MGYKPRPGLDERDRAAHEAAAIDASDPRAAAIARALVAGFFEPRAGAVALDVGRAEAILLGGDGLPALGDGDVSQRWGAHERPRHIALPVPIPHPAAPAAWAAALGWPPAVTEALLDGELYLDLGGAPRLWPWYPEQDAGERPAAEARAIELGVGLPEAHLDEPFESAWYLTRSGEAALARRLEGAAAPGNLEIEIVPVPDFGGPVSYEGGGVAPPIAAQRAALVSELAQQLEHIDDPEYREMATRRLRRAVAHYIDAVCGRPTAAAARFLELGGPPPRFAGDDEAPPEGATAILRVWSAGRGAAIACDGAIVVVDERGAVAKAWPSPDVPWAIAGGLALFEGEPWNGLDLETGQWPQGSIEAASLAGGPLLPHPELGPVGHDFQPPEVLSADGRYRFDFEEGIVRLEDNVRVAGDEVFGALYDDGTEDEEEEADGGAVAETLLEAGDLEVAGVTTTVIAGVTFTSRGRSSYRVEEHEKPAFALCGDGWRAFYSGSLRAGDREVARLGAVSHAAAFDRGGERLWVLGADHLIRIDWSGERPEVGAAAPLAPIAAAARAAKEPA